MANTAKTKSETLDASKAVSNVDNIDMANYFSAEIAKIKEEYDKQIKEQMASFKAQLEAMKEAMTAPVNTKVFTNNLNDQIKIVHLVQRVSGLTTHIKLSNLEIILRDLGEERTVTLQQFEEMVGKYRSWFTKGIISVAAGYEDIAERYGLSTAKGYPLNSEFMVRLGKFPMDKLETVFSRLPEAGQAFIISYWTRKALEKDPDFCDIRKIEILDRISDGGCTSLRAELNKKK